MFCGDKNAKLGILFCITAICKNEKAPINFFVLTANTDGKIEGLPAEFQAIMTETAKKATLKTPQGLLI